MVIARIVLMVASVVLLMNRVKSFANFVNLAMYSQIKNAKYAGMVK
jgi:hypothetical protein